MAASQKSGASRPHGAGVATGTGKPRPAILNIVPESQSLPHCNISSVKVRREPGQSLGNIFLRYGFKTD